MSDNSLTIAAIAALGDQRQIGKDNQLLWSIPEDLKRFKRLTSNHVVIMGRKTWESLPDAVQPLPERENVVLTRNKAYKAPGAVIKSSLEEALTYAMRWTKEKGQTEIFIIGGGRVYQEAFSKTDKLYLTLVDSDKDGDTFFPAYENEFSEIQRENHTTREPAFSFVVLERDDTL